MIHLSYNLYTINTKPNRSKKNLTLNQEKSCTLNSCKWLNRENCGNDDDYKKMVIKSPIFSMIVNDDI